MGVGTSITLFGIVLFQKIIEKFSVKDHGTPESKDNESFTDLRLVTEMPNVVYIQLKYLTYFIFNLDQSKNQCIFYLHMEKLCFNNKTRIFSNFRQKVVKPM